MHQLLQEIISRVYIYTVYNPLSIMLKIIHWLNRCMPIALSSERTYVDVRSLLSLSSNLKFVALFLLILSLSSSTTLFTISILQCACVLKVALPSYFIIHTSSYVMLQRIENLKGLCIVLYFIVHTPRT